MLSSSQLDDQLLHEHIRYGSVADEDLRFAPPCPTEISDPVFLGVKLDSFGIELADVFGDAFEKFLRFLPEDDRLFIGMFGLMPADDRWQAAQIARLTRCDVTDLDARYRPA